jgi:tetratricopeptide (TPR) repeat protein
MRDAPDSAATWIDQGLQHESRREWLDAVHCYQQAQANDPTVFEAALNLGAVLTQLKRFDDAEAAFRQAIALRPQSPATWSNLGAMLASQGRDADAEACCRHALSLDPTHRKARFNLAYVLLRQGRLAEGWLCLEAREGPAFLQSRLPMPRWDGEALAGRSLLVVSDAAHGDLIQMARYARVLKALGAGRLVLCAQPALTALLARETGFDEVLNFEAALPQSGFDLWTPAMSLPHLCGTHLENIPAHLPYLWPAAERLAHWQQSLQGLRPPGGRLIGLVWRGNPLHESDADRSVHDLGCLAPLGQATDVSFINLQHGSTPAEQTALSQLIGLRTPTEPLGDFEETAAIVANMDLVIGVDTSLVHLAGALGKPVWVLLHEGKTDWRWLNQGGTSPWYPGVMHLFRQPRAGDWPAVMADVAAQLRKV